jgi:hypothetical protein
LAPETGDPASPEDRFAYRDMSGQVFIGAMDGPAGAPARSSIALLFACTKCVGN